MAKTNPYSLIGEYELQRNSYISFSNALSQLMRDLISAAKLEVLAVESRTKTRQSFHDKVTSPDKRGKYESLSDVTDLSGIRIIAYLREDCDLICELLENNFNIDQKHSLDKGALHDDNQFGYQSRHYIVSLDKRRNKLPEFIPFAGLKAEIQVRTALQHAWAALDWRFRYKNAKEAPPEVRRKLYRISANLEGADENFSEVHKAVSELRLHYDGKIRAGDLKIPINSDSLTSFLSENVQFNNIYNKFVGAGFIPSEFDQDSLSRLQGNLETVGIKGLEDLARTIDSSSIKFDVFAGICIEETRKAFPSLNRVMTSKTSALRVSILATLNDEEFELAKFMLTEDAAETIARSRARYQAEV